jgi:hypothetical protein
MRQIYFGTPWVGYRRDLEGPRPSCDAGPMKKTKAETVKIWLGTVEEGEALLQRMRRPRYVKGPGNLLVMTRRSKRLHSTGVRNS